MQRRILLATAFAVFTGFAIVPRARAFEKKTALKVVIRNQYDKPVDNAAVILDFLGAHNIAKLGKRNKIHWELRSNLAGIADFPPVPEGTVQLQVITKKYQTYGKKIELAGEQQTLNITLNPPQQQYTAHPAPAPGAPKH